MGLHGAPPFIQHAKQKLDSNLFSDWPAIVNTNNEMTLLIDSSFLMHWLRPADCYLAAAVFGAEFGHPVIN
jgi:hypothetical protein